MSGVKLGSEYSLNAYCILYTYKQGGKIVPYLLYREITEEYNELYTFECTRILFSIVTSSIEENK